MCLPSERVVQEVSRRDGTDPLELPPLYSAIDPDALDAAVEGMAEGAVRFRYAGYSVTVRSDGTVSVTDRLPSGRVAAEPATDD